MFDIKFLNAFKRLIFAKPDRGRGGIFKKCSKQRSLLFSFLGGGYIVPPLRPPPPPFYDPILSDRSRKYFEKVRCFILFFLSFFFFWGGGDLTDIKVWEGHLFLRECCQTLGGGETPLPFLSHINHKKRIKKTFKVVVLFLLIYLLWGREGFGSWVYVLHPSSPPITLNYFLDTLFRINICVCVYHLELKMKGKIVSRLTFTCLR